MAVPPIASPTTKSVPVISVCIRTGKETGSKLSVGEAEANAVADSRRKRIPEFLQLLDQIKAQNFPAITAFIKQAQPTFLKAIGEIDNKLQLGLTQVEANLKSCKESIKGAPGNGNASQKPNSSAKATNEPQGPSNASNAANASNEPQAP